MTMQRIEVITSVQRRRRWSRAEKERVVLAALEPGAVITAVARAAGIHPSQVYRWRRELAVGSADAPAFVPMVLAKVPAGSKALSSPSGSIEIEFAHGSRLRIIGCVDAVSLSAAIAALTTSGARR
jgi:transposase